MVWVTCPYMCDMGTDDGSGTSSRRVCNESLNIDHEVFHLTKLRSEPSERTRKANHRGRKMPTLMVKMLSGRCQRVDSLRLIALICFDDTCPSTEHGPWTEWIPEHMCHSSLLMVHYLLQDFRYVSLSCNEMIVKKYWPLNHVKYTMLMMDGKCNKTFLLKACDGLTKSPMTKSCYNNLQKP